jgi:hypothetical protein
MKRKTNSFADLFDVKDRGKRVCEQRPYWNREREEAKKKERLGTIFEGVLVLSVSI